MRNLLQRATALIAVVLAAVLFMPSTAQATDNVPFNTTCQLSTNYNIPISSVWDNYNNSTYQGDPRYVSVRIPNNDPWSRTDRERSYVILYTSSTDWYASSTTAWTALNSDATYTYWRWTNPDDNPAIVKIKVRLFHSGSNCYSGYMG